MIKKQKEDPAGYWMEYADRMAYKALGYSDEEIEITLKKSFNRI